MAVSAGCHESAELLLLHGADVDAPDTKSGRTALLRAVESNSLEMAELLLRHGAAVNAQFCVENREFGVSICLLSPRLSRLLLR